MVIAGIDAGRHSVKVWHAGGFFDFYSNLGEWRNFEFKDEHGGDDIIGEYKGRKFTGGTLAKRESEFGVSLMTESKIHEDTVILILIAGRPTGEVLDEIRQRNKRPKAENE